MWKFWKSHFTWGKNCKDRLWDSGIPPGGRSPHNEELIKCGMSSFNQGRSWLCKVTQPWNGRGRTRTWLTARKSWGKCASCLTRSGTEEGRRGIWYVTQCLSYRVHLTESDGRLWVLSTLNACTQTFAKILITRLSIVIKDDISVQRKPI